MSECRRPLDTYHIPFAAWELRLYLNTHPTDRRALKLYRDLVRACPNGNYASIYYDEDCHQSDAQDSALDCIDSAACPLRGNLDDLVDADECCCSCGDSCPISWSWLEGPWPWEGACPGQGTCTSGCACAE